MASRLLMRASMDAEVSYNQTDLLARCRHEQDTLVEVACALRNQLLRAGLPDIVVPAQPQSCRLARDPYDGTTSLVGQWRKRPGKTIGSIVIHENGQLFAELDVLLSHPQDASSFVDAVVVFGTTGALHTELRITPAIT